MATLTLKCAGQKDLTFNFGQGAEGLSITDRGSNIIKNLFQAIKDGVYTAKTQAEYKEISVFLNNADADRNGTIDAKDADVIANNKNNATGITVNGGADYTSIDKKKKDGNFYSIFIN